MKKKSERPVDALAVKKSDSLTVNFKSRDASASKKLFEKHKHVDVSLFHVVYWKKKGFANN